MGVRGTQGLSRPSPWGCLAVNVLISSCKQISKEISLGFHFMNIFVNYSNVQKIVEIFVVVLYMTLTSDFIIDQGKI